MTASILSFSLFALAGFATAQDDICDQNTCYQAYNAIPTAASSFCSRFTAGITTTTSEVPNYATQPCAVNMVSQISSICSCAYPATTSGSSTAPTSSSITPILETGSTITITNTVSAIPVASSSMIADAARIPIGCKEDNCLRAMIREGNIDATSFCQSFTTTTVDDLTALPTYASMCTSNAVSGISSACSCFVPKTTTLRSNGTQTTELSTFTTTTVTSTTTLAVLTTLTTVTVSIDPARLSIPVGCAEDNCLRAMIREGNVNATPFCRNFTTATISDLNALPTYASMCTPNPISGISSACSCFVPKPTRYSNGTITANFTSTISPSTAPSGKEVIPIGDSGSSNAAPEFEVKNLICNEDNCLRAMIREGNVNATPFCNAFTTSVIADEAALPTYASMCTPVPIAGISSACSCYVPPSTPTPASTGRGVGCNEDNCLRAMIREGGRGAATFCGQFTTDVITNPAALPTYASMCSPDPVIGVSSACSCI